MAEIDKSYDIDIQYCPGKANVVADALSKKSREQLNCMLTSEEGLIKDMEAL